MSKCSPSARLANGLLYACDNDSNNGLCPKCKKELKRRKEVI